MRIILRNASKLRSFESCFSKNAIIFNRGLSTTSQPLESVDLSYATYETTSGDQKTAPLIVMHGLFGSKSNWNSLCKVYQQKTVPKRKIISIDARNHGESPHSNNHSYAYMADDIRQLLHKLNIEKVALLGHSMGGRAVMLFALKYPELVEKLIVADISPVTNSPNLNFTPNIFSAMERVQLPDDVPMSKARTMADGQLSGVVQEKDVRAFLLTNLVQSSEGKYKWRINLPALINNFNHVAKFPDTGDLSYDGPVFFVAGGISDFVGKSDLPKIKKLFPKAELKFIEGAGHWLHAEKPSEFLNLTLNFLNK